MDRRSGQIERTSSSRRKRKTRLAHTKRTARIWLNGHNPAGPARLAEFLPFEFSSSRLIVLLTIPLEDVLLYFEDTTDADIAQEYREIRIWNFLSAREF